MLCLGLVTHQHLRPLLQVFPLDTSHAWVGLHGSADLESLEEAVDNGALQQLGEDAGQEKEEELRLVTRVFESDHTKPYICPYCTGKEGQPKRLATQQNMRRHIDAKHKDKPQEVEFVATAEEAGEFAVPVEGGGAKGAAGDGDGDGDGGERHPGGGVKVSIFEVTPYKPPPAMPRGRGRVIAPKPSAPLRPWSDDGVMSVVIGLAIEMEQHLKGATTVERWFVDRIAWRRGLANARSAREVGRHVLKLNMSILNTGYTSKWNNGGYKDWQPTLHRLNAMVRQAPRFVCSCSLTQLSCYAFVVGFVSP